MAIITPETDFPADFKKEEIEAILKLVGVGESLGLVSAKGMGQSFFLRFLTRHPKIREDFPKNLTLVAVDLNDLVKSSPSSFFRLLPQRSFEAFKNLDPGHTLLIEARRLFKEGTSAAEVGYTFNCLKKLLLIFSDELKLITVFILDPFGGVALKMGEQFFMNLKALRDQRKHTLSFIFALHNHPHLLHPERREGIHLELLCQNILFISPLKEKESFAFVQSFEKRAGVNFEGELKQSVIKLTGGHCGLLKDSLRFLLREQPAKIDEENLIKDAGIKARCQALLSSLTEEQRELLVEAAYGRNIDPKRETEVVLLKMLNLLRAQKRKLTITIPILECFLRKQGLKTRQEILIHPATQEVLVRGHPLVEPLSRMEFKLLSFLLEHPGRVCSKDEIAEEVWEGSPEGVSDEAIDKLVQRLRGKIEEDKSRPQYLITHHGRGYQLKV